MTFQYFINNIIILIQIIYLNNLKFMLLWKIDYHIVTVKYIIIVKLPNKYIFNKLNVIWTLKLLYYIILKLPIKY